MGADQLYALYGIRLQDDSLVLLLRLRAARFVLLGTFLIYAAFRPGYRSFALSAGLVSVLSFLLLALPGSGAVGEWSPQIQQVIHADILALTCLAGGSVAHPVQLSGKWSNA